MSIAVGAPPLSEMEHAQAYAREFDAFVGRNAQLAYRVAYAMLRNGSDAEDAVQESFLKLYRSRRWQAAESESSFTARTVWRMAATLRGRSGPVVPDLPDNRPSLDPSPEQMMLDARAEAAVHRLIDALPERLRQPLVLSSFGELRSAEVAAILGVPESTVRRRVMEARALLREKLKNMEENRART